MEHEQSVLELPNCSVVHMQELGTDKADHESSNLLVNQQVLLMASSNTSM
jgi:hypothetical protein